MAIPTVTAYVDNDDNLWNTEAQAIKSNTEIAKEALKEDTLIFLKTIPREVFSDFKNVNKETVKSILKRFVFHLVDKGYSFTKDP
jgi:hypothetical protein